MTPPIARHTPARWRDDRGKAAQGGRIIDALLTGWLCTGVFCIPDMPSASLGHNPQPADKPDKNTVFPHAKTPQNTRAQFRAES